MHTRSMSKELGANPGMFLLEWVALNRSPNQLPISSVCNANCIFCSNHLNPFPIAGGVFRELDDIKHQLALMPMHDKPIRLSDCLPGRIAEGEAFLHPQIFEILKLIRRKYIKNTLCVTTNASMLSETFLARLADFRPFEITVSLMSTQPELWARIFRRREHLARAAIEALPKLKPLGIGLVGSIVALPAICGWADIEQTYNFLAAAGAQRMMIWEPGYTRQTPPNILEQVHCDPQELSDFAQRMRARHNLPLMVHPQLEGELSLPVGRIIEHTLGGNPKNLFGPFRQVVWLASQAAAPRIAGMLAREGRPGHVVLPVENHTYGGNIVVAGLLMVEDLVRAGKQALERWPQTELFLVPQSPFDAFARDLTGVPAHRIEEQLGRSTWLVDIHGNVDPLLTKLFNPGAAPTIPEPQRIVEKFNQGWLEEDLQLLEQTCTFPLDVGGQGMDLETFYQRLLQEKKALSAQGDQAGRVFEYHSAGFALCRENWPLAARVDPVQRWIFLRKQEQGWRISQIIFGEIAPIPAGNGAKPS